MKSKWSREESDDEVIFETDVKKTIPLNIVWNKHDEYASVYFGEDHRDDIEMDLMDATCIEDVEKQLDSIFKQLKNE